MENFTFEKQEIKKIPISIDSRIYQAKADLKTIKAIEQYSNDLKPLIKKLHNNMNYTEVRKINQNVMRITKRCLDTIFGKGAYYKIFANRAIDFTEHCNLMSFVFDQIKESSQ